MLSALLALTQASSPDLTARIVGASVFKNGYAVVTRRLDVGPAGTYRLKELPASAMGTLWIRSSEGTRLKSVIAKVVRTPTEVTLGSLDAILRANVGKRVVLRYRDPKGELVAFEGTIKGAEGEIVVLAGNDGDRAIPKAGLAEIQAANGVLLFTTKAESAARVLEIRTEGSAGQLEMVSLERGITWVPAYAVDVTDPKTLRLTAKATLVNDLENLNGVDLRLVTGFPNLPYATLLEPLFQGTGSLDGIEMFSRNRDAMSVPPVLMNQAMGLEVAPAKMADFDTTMAQVPGAGGESREDLFFYRLPNQTLGKSERAYQVLFSFTSSYSDLYTWDVADYVGGGVAYQPIPEGPQDVWHALRFTNSKDQPLTTSIATTFDGGEIVGQDILGYVPAGAETELRVNKSLDIRAEGSEEEEGRERGAIKNRDGVPIYDLVTVRGTLRVTNLKRTAVPLRVRRFLTGEVTDNGGATATKTAAGLARINPTARLVWERTLKPGEVVELRYAYRLYVGSAG